MEEENINLLIELEALENNALIAIVRNENEEDVNRLQVAWEILDRRGLKEKLLSQIEQEDEAKKLSLNDLIHPENEEAISDNAFAEKIDFLVGSEIKAKHIDVLGGYKPTLAIEVDLDARKESPEEKAIQLKKLRAQLYIAAASFVALLVSFVLEDWISGKLLIQWGLVAHILVKLFMAGSTYLSHKNEN